MNENLKEAYDVLKAKLPTDVMALDDELMELGQTVQDAAEYATKAISLSDALKNEYEVSRARAERRIREVPDGWKKPPETQVASEALLDTEVRENFDLWQDALADAALWKSLVQSFRTKQDSIKTLAALISAGYTTTQTITNKRREELHQARLDTRNQP